MLGLGLASSHAPQVFAPAHKWEIPYRGAIAHTVESPQGAGETLETIQSHVDRIERAFQQLAAKLAEFRPDALVMVGDDQREVFDPSSNMPTIAMYLGAEAVGAPGLDFIGAAAPGPVRLRGHQALAEYLAQGLVDQGFDLACLRELKPAGRPERGLGHAFTRAPMKLMPSLDIPVVIVFLNAYYPPLPSAQRCYDLGTALRELLDRRPERVAIYGSGGLSHDPGGPRAGWIDEPLDRFVLDAIAAGEPERLLGLYTVDSDTMRGGTGEIRSWITVASALADRRATVVDYIPAYHAVTGLGFAYWE